MTQGREWHLRYGDQVATVAQRGGAIRSYTVGGRAVVHDVGDGEVPAGYQGAVLAPWPNRLRAGRWSWEGTSYQLPVNEVETRSALHGLLSWTAWQEVATGADQVELAAVVLPQPGYPFEVEFAVRWSLSGSGLACELLARNLGERAAPFGVGAHPYFTLPPDGVDGLTLRLPAATWQATDDRQQPTGLRPTAGSPLDFSDRTSLRDLAIDTAFTDLPVSAAGSTVELAGAAGRLEIWADAQFPWWQVYTSDHFPRGSRHHRRAVAVEPMTCGPDALNTGRDLVVLPPGGQWRGRWGVRPFLAAG